MAKQVAAKFVQDSDIIAVIGHNASNASVAAAPIYDIEKFNLVVCEDFRSLDNKSYRAEFQISLAKYGGKVIPFDCNLADPNLKPDPVIKQAVKQGADGLFLAAYIDSIQEAIKVAQANQGKLKLSNAAERFSSR